MKRNCKNLDERQLLERGNVFQHVCVLLFVLLMANGFLKSEGITWAEGMYENLLILWAGMALAFSEFIIREITPMGSGMKVFYVLLGICGAFLAGMSLVHHFAQGDAWVEHAVLTDVGSCLIEGCFMLLILLVFLCKSIYNCRRAKQGDEE